MTVLTALAAYLAATANGNPLPVPQGVTARLPANGATPAGCKLSYGGQFGITVVRTNGLLKRDDPVGQIGDGQIQNPSAGQQPGSGAQQPGSGAQQPGSGAQASPSSPASAGSSSVGSPAAVSPSPAPQVTAIGDGQPQAPPSKRSGPVGQIADGQVQNQQPPTSPALEAPAPGVHCPVPCPPAPVVSSEVPHVTAIADGQPQVPTPAKLKLRRDSIGQISDGQVQNGNGNGNGGESGNNGGSGTGNGNEGGAQPGGPGASQAPAAAATSAELPHITVIPDGQPQAPPARLRKVRRGVVGQIPDGQIQNYNLTRGTECYEKVPQVSEIADGQPEAPPVPQVTQIVDGQPEALPPKPAGSESSPSKPAGSEVPHVTAIPDGQPQVPAAYGDYFDHEMFDNKEELIQAYDECLKHPIHSLDNLDVCAYDKFYGMKVKRSHDPCEMNDPNDVVKVLSDCIEGGSLTKEQLDQCAKCPSAKVKRDDRVPRVRHWKDAADLFKQCKEKAGAVTVEDFIGCFDTGKVPTEQVLVTREHFRIGEDELNKVTAYLARIVDSKTPKGYKSIWTTDKAAARTMAWEAWELAHHDELQPRADDCDCDDGLLKRDFDPILYTCKGPSTLKLDLHDGTLTDALGRTGYIAANYQFQFDEPPQAGAIVTHGFSVCEDGRLALGGSRTWYQCASGAFYNLYDRKWAPHCEPIQLQVVELRDCGSD